MHASIIPVMKISAQEIIMHVGEICSLIMAKDYKWHLTLFAKKLAVHAKVRVNKFFDGNE